ncbi:MAG: PEP-CTERM sorting domain-containing protein [Chthonomonas sp.]|nr:PEP-CTERM sorting domain-containing protein [Chthonomonas sp.]
MTRLLIGFGCLAFATGAQASFDLMFIQEATPTNSIYRVHRVDPANGVSLGSFQIGPESKGLAASYARRELYSIDINGNLRTYDYSTGAQKSLRATGFSNVADFVLSADGTSLLIAHNTGQIRTFNLTTNGTGTLISSGTAQFSKLHQAANGDVYAYAANLGMLQRYNSGGFTLQSQEVNGGTTVGQMTYLASVQAPYGTVYYGAGAGYGFNPTYNNNFYFGGGFSNGVSGHQSVVSAVRSHTGAYVIGMDSGGSLTRVTEIDSASYHVRTNTFAGINGGVKSVAVVLAPEPGTLAAIGLGIAALLKRRRK